MINPNLECLITCDSAHGDCFNSCPCHIFCPEGCRQCPDSPYCVCSAEETIEDKAKCINEFEQVYRQCGINCNHDTTCISQCGREYNQNILTCPCTEGCPQGCPCPEYECSITSTEQPTTTTTKVRSKFLLIQNKLFIYLTTVQPNILNLTVDIFQDVLVMWAGYDNTPTHASITDFDGSDTSVQWTNHIDATAYSMCSFIFEDDIFILG